MTTNKIIVGTSFSYSNMLMSLVEQTAKFKSRRDEARNEVRNATTGPHS
jgi:hypothetical protein